jgi:trimeric autotransporter adhesin
MKKRSITGLATTLCVLFCSALLPLAQAVIPSPDGGYPGGNTAEGTNALLSLTTGQNNTAVGLNALSSTTTGNFNTAIGSAALRFNTANYNTAVGRNALFSNRFAEHNTAIGDIALYSNIAGDANTAVGDSAMYRNTSGGANTAVGEGALHRNTRGDANTAIGSSALTFNTTGNFNTAVGDGALIRNTTSSFNIALGTLAGADVTMVDNVICIGAPGANVSNSCYIGNIWQQPGGSQAVYVNADGKLGAQVSSRRFKDEIKPIEQASEAIYGLKPVSFRYKPEIEPTRPVGFGLIAEDVEKIDPDLVNRDKQGKAYSVRYDQVNAMLLNEFLKEHKTVQELKKEIAALRATVKDQDSKIDRISDQLELNKPSPQLVDNNQ